MALTKVKSSNITLSTPAASSNDTTPATTAYVTTALANMVDSAPSTLNTLNELAAALGDDANFSTTVTNSIAAKAPLAGPTFTGDVDIDGSDDLRLRFLNGSTFKGGIQVPTSTGDMISGAAVDDLAIRSQANMLFSTGGNTEKVRIDTNGYVRLQESSKTHHSAYLGFMTPNGGVISEETGAASRSMNFVHNGYVDAGNEWTFMHADEASLIQHYNGATTISNSAAGSADSTITWTERMRVAANGNVGIGGNATPLQALEVYRNSSSGSQGGYAGISLRNDHSSGYMACQFHEGSTLRGDILFQNGVDDMQFRVGGGGTERMRITSSGTLLISTNAASGLSNSNSNFGHSFGGGQQVNSTNNDLCLILNRNLGSGTMLAIRNNGSNVGSITQNGSSTSFNTSSDYRLKENVNYSWDATTRLKQLKPARFNFIADETNTLVEGFLAHEVSSIVPEAITGTKDEVDGDGNPEYQGIDQSKLIPLLVKTIQELEARITTLEG